MGRVRRVNPGDFVPPMLAVTQPVPFSRSGWWFETKWDGYRAIVSSGEHYRVYSRRGHDLLASYPALQEAAELLPREIVLDAELVAWVDGRPDFGALQRKAAQQYLLMVFDCLYAKGRWLMHEPLERRLGLLHDAVRTEGMVVVSDGVSERGEAYLDAIRRLDLEGVMAKRLDSPYFPGRRSAVWQKFLALKSQWCWVVAYHQTSDGSWTWHLAEQSQGRLTNIGKVPAPMTWRALSTGSAQIAEPFPVEVAFREKTREGHLRHARVRQWPQRLADHSASRSDLVPGSRPHPPGGG